MTERYFRIEQEDTCSELREIRVGVPQGSMIVPVLYHLYTSDLLTFEQMLLPTFADDTANMAVGNNVIETTEKLRAAKKIGHRPVYNMLFPMEIWLNTWA